jgi:hypothetical protein
MGSCGGLDWGLYVIYDVSKCSFMMNRLFCPVFAMLLFWNEVCGLLLSFTVR